jgi:serine/threonine-protein kinase
VQAAERGDSLIGASLADKYRVLRQIGRGGMGIVYEAEHTGLGKRVAVKLMLEKYSDDREAIARFHREAVAAGRIGNPHIIEIFDLGVAPDGRSFAVMELLGGFPLSKVIEMGGAMPPWRAIEIMRQVLRGVAAAHAKGIIHRDLKPDNIFLVQQQEHHDFVKLLDFGISKTLTHAEHAAVTKLTTTGVVMGTPLYMAPEQALGEGIGCAADLYACGVILFEMLAGRPPFDGPTYAALVAKVLTSPPPRLDEICPGLPPALTRAVHRALEKEPSARFASAEQFAAALPSPGPPIALELAGTLDGHASMVAAPAPGRRRRAAIAGATFALAAGITAATLVWTEQAPTPGAEAGAGTRPSSPEGASATRLPLASAAQGAPLERAPDPREPSGRDHSPPLATTGRIEVKSKPSGATVTIGGRVVGQTPIVVALPAGRHEVRVVLAGYAPVSTHEEVRVGERTALPVTLIAAPSRADAARLATHTHVRHELTNPRQPRPTRPPKAGSATALPHDAPAEVERAGGGMGSGAAPPVLEVPSPPPRRDGARTKANPYP